ncbi:MAG: DUF4011 domain-containing protein [Phycisphaeraceae bacterium]|nr:DUF4011 domain-containing protein [Phycisphaeraceae bacterium]
MSDAASTQPVELPPPGKILPAMLDRLFAAIAGGPSLNCRPHSSRQRIDLAALSSLDDATPTACLLALLGPQASARVVARVKPAPPIREDESDDIRALRVRYAAQLNLISKLRILVDEARTYEDDTGVHVLNVGFPVLHLPPSGTTRRGTPGRRILAPVAFIPVSLSVQGGAAPAIVIECQSDEVDRVVPNEALLAWIEQQTGIAADSHFHDEDGSQPWKEIAAIVQHVCKAMDAPLPEAFAVNAPDADFEINPIPVTERLGDRPEVLASAVLGLFPASKQGLIRDTKEMVAKGSPEGPIKRFVSPRSAFGSSASPAAQPTVSSDAARLVAQADPCQAGAVAKARQEDALVIHGPPGTGKSQTITNIIGDSLVRGERVLFVCEKRTALDVVANRLEAIGLGHLCALIHDPQRDQKNLYMSIRQQLDGLVEHTPREGLDRALSRLDGELLRIHGELTEFRALLNCADADGRTLHDLVGQVLRLAPEAAACPVRLPPAAAPNSDSINAAETDVREVLARGLEVEYVSNPWGEAAGLPLADLLGQPGQRIRERMDSVVRAAAKADETIDVRIDPFAPDLPLGEQADARLSLAESIQSVLSSPHIALRRSWAGRPVAELKTAGGMLAELDAAAARAAEGPLDAELLLTVRSNPPTAASLGASIGSLEAYLRSTKSIFGFLAFGKRRAAERVLSPLGLALNPESAERARTFMSRLRALLVVRACLDTMSDSPVPHAPVPDATRTLAEAAATSAVVRLLLRVHGEPALVPLAKPVTAALAQETTDSNLLWGLRASPRRAASLQELERLCAASALFGHAWLKHATTGWRAGEAAMPTMESLSARLPTLESVLRIRERLSGMRADVRAPLESFLKAGVDPEPALQSLYHAAASAQVASLIEANPKLHAADARRVQTLFDRWHELEGQRRAVVRDLTVSKWLTIQRSRLVVGTGSRLSSEGAKIRQRLITRGARALRLRQVLALGREVEGGDPILDLRPVWMASPETVAQVFPREPVFDVVIFDEASQCRLEDALPVLTRAKRVVIAGDPKQLPPTRFFESAAISSDEDPIASDDDLFESQQSQSEDLLSAALNLSLEESYLDVHYRSRNADLIEFSNEHFYSKRLQAIPAHPRHRTCVPPLSLRRVAGLYKNRQNEPEASEVVRIVKDLLRRAEPPSIGIACFNLPQRDLIVEKLDEAAEADPEFAARLQTSRARRSGGAPDGLFVKNLENVQGDERDHMIISTTFGPDEKGKFHRRFGPLLQPGGGRRLNVLITRARHEVHLVTSIPREVYLTAPEVPLGAAPGGGWLLLAYLRYAEALEAAYAQSGTLSGDGSTDLGGTTELTVNASSAPSAIATELGSILAREHSTGSIVHWGNDGFCVDLALRHPTRPLDVTCGVLCDFARYAPGSDPVEWDIFRTAILQRQGWHLERVWSPATFRDPAGCLSRIRSVAERIARDEDKADAIAVTHPTRGASGAPPGKG